MIYPLCHSDTDAATSYLNFFCLWQDNGEPIGCGSEHHKLITDNGTELEATGV
jgi:hypothetical protein